MERENNIGDNRLVKCSFCPEMCTLENIGEHLMQCGNKTEQCPNCEKYVRRAVFAYHYENNCANLEDTESEVADKINRYDKPSISDLQPLSNQSEANNPIPCEICNELIPLAALQEHSDRCYGPEDNQKEFQCEYCGSPYSYQLVRDAHQMTCEHNPSVWPMIKATRQFWNFIYYPSCNPGSG